MRRCLLYLSVWFCGTQVVDGQSVQWASEVIRFSTEYTRKMYSARQVLGPPDKLPAVGESAVAWAPSTPDNPNGEFIHVGFERPMQIQQVAIGENNSPGAVAEVILVSTNGKKYTVFEQTVKPSYNPGGGMLHIFFPLTDYEVKEVKVILHTKPVAGMNQIDCIGISSLATPIQAVINEVNFDQNLVAENLGPQVNSFADDMLPMVSPDGSTLYFARKRHPENVGDEKRDDIWYSKKQEDGSWGPAMHLDGYLNNEHHNYVAWISPDGNTLALANDYKNPGIGQRVSISTQNNGNWQFPNTLPVNDMYNENEFSCYHLNTEGNVLLLAIERGDTYGDMDIYVSFKRSNQAWTRPLNIGQTVNTAGTEGSVFLAADNRTIYFASNGHSGYGGFDMFMCRRLDDSWTLWSEPLNLGRQINSVSDDFYYTVPATADYLYFSSSNQSYGRADLFRIPLPPELQPEPVAMMKVTVLDAETGKPVLSEVSYGGLIAEEPQAITPRSDVILIVPENNYEITIRKDGYLPITSILDVDESDPELDFNPSDPVQTITYELKSNTIPKLKEQAYTREEMLTMIAEKLDTMEVDADLKEQVIQEVEISLESDSLSTPSYRESTDSIYMVPIREGQILTLDNVFFDANKSVIREESFAQLDEIAQFLVENPKLFVEIGGHTNGLPEDDFCFRLSNNRAESVRQYLISKGASPDNISFKGYGKTQPVADNNTLAGRQKNQRVELKIIKVQ